ncbi:hypothetical protein CYMTET_22948 [Cymbomonas tetramitiformis]|uniref:Uncharacterized protein n=1 Tax=Cymbomonas tetramitiformis TaxID=36881 RepID=A0AAE0FZ72_9CHLO|nr:hypothetical protein CYMTET_22948 [Cymbomonas tetramitiformis]
MQQVTELMAEGERRRRLQQQGSRLRADLQPPAHRVDVCSIHAGDAEGSGVVASPVSALQYSYHWRRVGLYWYSVDSRGSVGVVVPVYDHYVSVNTLGAFRPGSGFGQRQWEAGRTAYKSWACLCYMLCLQAVFRREPIVVRDPTEELRRRGYVRSDVSDGDASVPNLCSEADTQSVCSAFDDSYSEAAVLGSGAAKRVFCGVERYGVGSDSSGVSVFKVAQGQTTQSVGDDIVSVVKRDLDSGGLPGLDLAREGRRHVIEEDSLGEAGAHLARPAREEEHAPSCRDNWGWSFEDLGQFIEQLGLERFASDDSRHLHASCRVEDSAFGNSGSGQACSHNSPFSTMLS